MSSLPFSLPLIAAIGLSVHGLRKGSLSPTGASAAFAVGYTMLSVPLRAFGVALLVFYLAGSRATKVGKTLKKKLEEGHQDAGYRNAAQVLCNSLSAIIAALLWSALYEPGSGPAQLLQAANVTWLPGEHVPYNFDEWCPLTPPPAASWSRALLFVTLGNPLPRPPGTNGGLSRVGTLASLFGGLIMGGTHAAALLAQSAACRATWVPVVVPLLLWGTLAGGLGSLLDSLMGATLQCTRFLNSTKRILTDEAPAPAPGADVKVVSGYDILTNNQVNLLSSIITAVVLGALA
ncbi:integral membrane protein DUF92-domain-containing protein [Trametes maxima]|nr:integral membrane protein DUF92-domain-containing protein [Trametes maxima]